MAGTTTLNQNRTQTKVNALTAFSTSTGTAWATPALNAAGNMTTVPQPASLGSGYALTFDAWNRLVKVMNGGTTIATYAYDGQNWRIKKTTGSTTRDYYFTVGWQIIEEQVSSSMERQFVWGLMGLDNLILRDRQVWVGEGEVGEDESSSSSSSSSGGPVLITERLYALSDYASVTAIVKDGGHVHERYGYNAFGQPLFMTQHFEPKASSNYEWETLYASYRFDAETGFFQVRNRFYHPTLGRFINRDPIGLAGGVNLYAYVGNNAVNRTDPRGLDDTNAGSHCPCCEMLKKLAKMRMQFSNLWSQITSLQDEINNGSPFTSTFGDGYGADISLIDNTSKSIEITELLKDNEILEAASPIISLIAMNNDFSDFKCALTPGDVDSSTVLSKGANLVLGSATLGASLAVDPVPVFTESAPEIALAGVVVQSALWQQKAYTAIGNINNTMATISNLSGQLSSLVNECQTLNAQYQALCPSRQGPAGPAGPAGNLNVPGR